MSLLSELYRDECGALISAELVMLGTIGVVGATVGLSAVSTAVNEELKDLAYAIRSLDQSYSFRGFRSCGAYSAGSCYTQRPVAESLASLCVGEDDDLRDEAPQAVPFDDAPVSGESIPGDSPTGESKPMNPDEVL